ncbi:hypothetical protein DEU56DRAFT_738020 [Suillus clintonianus]|uniref:uncharacterized protein n=1 Tax=Suillus clintonianus TaxID=1904413 RepID=UPI001B886B96|nr:uncharacterized protein DEU56DRAFT_738020 [Suillus clintonianus]KAG2135341.1 hypothetical protein DEU56DRAFT_738020 [Suillus clintonianus]
MVSHKSAQRNLSVRTQALTRTRAKVQLSKEARVALTLRRREASLTFKKALEDAWQTVDDAAIKIAADHKKTVRRVQHELHMGHSLLQAKHSKVSAWNSFLWKKGQDSDKENYGHGKDVLGGIMRDFKAEYYDLTKEEKTNLIEEYKEYKATKTTGQRISTKSKINDVTHTLKAIESELDNLRSRTGAETILYMTRGTTDLPLRGVTFATEGVQDFMESAVGIDNQDLVNKMEGFAIQGMRGAALNHQERVASVRAQIRAEINQALRKKTGVPDATMQWAQYWRNVVKRYSVVITGWPKEIPFVNLSTASSALPDLERLLRKWRSEAIKWKRLTAEELAAMEKERDQEIEDGLVKETRRRVRSDKGKKRRQNADDDEEIEDGKTYKSTENVNSDGEDDRPDSPVPATTQAEAGSPFEDSNTPSANRASTAPLIPAGANETPTNQEPVLPGTNALHSESLGPAPAPPILPDFSADLGSLFPPFNDFIDNFVPVPFSPTDPIPSSGPMPFAHTEFNFDGVGFPSY